VVIDCEFSQNSAAAGGAFFVLDDGAPRVENCTFHDNIAAGMGGGVGVESGASLRVRDCHFWSNIGSAGGAICVAAGSAVISECVVDSNEADFGGGINIMSSTRAVVERTIVTGNAATYAGGGIYALYGDDATIVNSTIVGNTCEAMGGGIYSSSTELTLRNAIVATNYGNGGIYLDSGNETTIAYNDFWDNAVNDFLGQVPTGLGILAATNANGDSCDVSFNIFLDPDFVDSMQEDYHLTQSSPCIDAGDPSSPVDPDGTLADIGAIPFDQGFSIWCELMDGEILLNWYPLPDAATYWIYGAPEDAWFDPDLSEPYQNRIDVLPEGSDTWSSTLGIGDPAVNWSFLVVAIGENAEELRRSNRVAEYDVSWIVNTILPDRLL
jgi:hypothetical protein